MGILDKFKTKKKDEDASDKASDLNVVESVKEEKKTTSSIAKTDSSKPKAEKVKKEAHHEVVLDKEMAVGKFHSILLKPMVSEKNSVLANLNQYVFEVAVTANKIQIAHAIKAKYGVEPIRVNVSNIMGKNVRHGKYFGKKKDTKKATIFLPAGKSIDIYKGV